MKTLLDSVGASLQQCGANVFQADGLLAAVYVLNGEAVIGFVELAPSADVLAFVIPCIFSTQPAANTAPVLRRLLLLNYQWKFCHFHHQPDTGEIGLRVDVPVENGTLSFEQVRRMYFGVLSLLDSERNLLWKLIYTGVDEQKQIDSSVRVLLESEGAGGARQD